MLRDSELGALLHNRWFYLIFTADTTVRWYSDIADSGLEGLDYR